MDEVNHHAQLPQCRAELRIGWPQGSILAPAEDSKGQRHQENILPVGYPDIFRLQEKRLSRTGEKGSDDQEDDFFGGKPRASKSNQSPPETNNNPTVKPFVGV